MRSLCGVYVDVGYLLASAGARVSGSSLRSSIHVEYGPLIREIVRQAETHSQLPCLRVHWYDAGRRGGGADEQQQRIGLLPRVKLRLGRSGFNGEQKGVDLRIGLDLVTHARNGSIDMIYLLSGDDDLTEAVDEAQSHGIQVILIAAPDTRGEPVGVSSNLQRTADDLIVLEPATVDATVLKTEAQAPGHDTQSPTPPSSPILSPPSPALLAGRAPGGRTGPPAPTAPRPVPSSALVYANGPDGHLLPSVDAEPEVIEEVCAGALAAWRLTATPAIEGQLLATRPFIPPDLDRALLVDLSAKVGAYDLSEPTRFELRRVFWETAERAMRR